MNALEFKHVWKKFRKGERFNSLRDRIPHFLKNIASKSEITDELDDKVGDEGHAGAPCQADGLAVQFFQPLVAAPPGHGLFHKSAHHDDHGKACENTRHEEEDPDE